MRAVQRCDKSHHDRNRKFNRLARISHSAMDRRRRGRRTRFLVRSAFSSRSKYIRWLGGGGGIRLLRWFLGRGVHRGHFLAAKTNPIRLGLQVGRRLGRRFFGRVHPGYGIHAAGVSRSEWLVLRQVMSFHMPIDADLQQQEAASPHALVVRSFLRCPHKRKSQP
jgi:hypothetical protein